MGQTFPLYDLFNRSTVSQVAVWINPEVRSGIINRVSSSVVCVLLLMVAISIYMCVCLPEQSRRETMESFMPEFKPRGKRGMLVLHADVDFCFGLVVGANTLCSLSMACRHDQAFGDMHQALASISEVCLLLLPFSLSLSLSLCHCLCLCLSLSVSLCLFSLSACLSVSVCLLSSSSSSSFLFLCLSPSLSLSLSLPLPPLSLSVAIYFNIAIDFPTIGTTKNV